MNVLLKGKFLLKPVNIDKINPVVICWKDAASAELKGTKQEIAEEFKDCIRYSVGYLVDKINDHVVIASDYDEFVKGEGHYESVSQIPIAMVVKIIKLCISKPTSSGSSRPRHSKPSSLSQPDSSPSSITLNQVETEVFNAVGYPTPCKHVMHLPGEPCDAVNISLGSHE